MPLASSFLTAAAGVLLLVPAATAGEPKLFPGRGNPRSECFGAVQISTPTAGRDVQLEPNGRRVSMEACGSGCLFALQLCANVPTDRCTPRPLKSMLVFGDTGELLPTPEPDEDPSQPTVINCGGSFGSTFVAAGKTRRIEISTRVKGRPRRDHDVLVLRCLPSTRPCCGDGVVDPGEDCDGSSESIPCDPNCRFPGCGNGHPAAGESCDDGNGTDGDGCDSNCRPTGCHNGIVTEGEDCEGEGENPACNEPDTECAACACVPKRCDCGDAAAGASGVEFTWSQATGECGSAFDGAGTTLQSLQCGHLHLGGGPPTANIPVELVQGPDVTSNLALSARCLGPELRLSPAGGGAGCSTPGCLLGRPVPFTGAAGPTCLVMTITGEARGSIDCDSWSSVDLRIPVDVEVFLGPVNSTDPVEACPSGCGATRDSCGPTSGLVPAGVVHLPDLSLRAPADDLVASDGTFCGYCYQPVGCFEGDPDPSCANPGDGEGTACSAAHPCPSETFPTCTQQSAGFFGHPSAQRIHLETQVPGDLRDFLPHPATLGVLACVPPTFERVCLDPPCLPGATLNVDYSASLPGPAAATLRGTFRLLPSP